MHRNQQAISYSSPNYLLDQIQVQKPNTKVATNQKLKSEAQ